MRVNYVLGEKLVRDVNYSIFFTLPMWPKERETRGVIMLIYKSYTVRTACLLIGSKSLSRELGRAYTNLT